MVSNNDNIDKINARLEKLREYVLLLEGYQTITLEQLENDALKRGALERYLQLSIEACIDIAELIISEQRFKAPATAREAIEILGREGVVNEEFAIAFSKAVGLRNILIHDYLTVDYELLLRTLKDKLPDFHRFIKEIVTFLT